MATIFRFRKSVLSVTIRVTCVYVHQALYDSRHVLQTGSAGESEPNTQYLIPRRVDPIIKSWNLITLCDLVLSPKEGNIPRNSGEKVSGLCFLELLSGLS